MLSSQWTSGQFRYTVIPRVSREKVPYDVKPSAKPKRREVSGRVEVASAREQACEEASRKGNKCRDCVNALTPPRNSSSPINSSALNKKFKKDKSGISSRRSNLSPAAGHEILGSGVEGKSPRPVAAFTDTRRLRCGCLRGGSPRSQPDYFL